MPQESGRGTSALTAAIAVAGFLLSGCGGAAFKVARSVDPYTGVRTVTTENNLLTDSVYPGQRRHLDHGLYVNPRGSRDPASGDLFDMGLVVMQRDGDPHALGYIRRVDLVMDRRDSLSLDVVQQGRHAYRRTRTNYGMIALASLAAMGDVAAALDPPECDECCPPREPYSAAFTEEDFEIEEDVVEESGAIELTPEEMQRLVEARRVEVTVVNDLHTRTVRAGEMPGAFLRNLRKFWDALTAPFETAGAPEAIPEEASASRSAPEAPAFRGSAFGIPAALP